MKSRITVTVTGKTTAEGPIQFGVECNFADAVAVQAVLDADPQKRTDDNARGAGTFLMILDKVGLVPTVMPASDEGFGKVYEISYGKNGWSIPEGSALNYWAKNNDSSALTTGTAFQIDAEHFGVWLND